MNAFCLFFSRPDKRVPFIACFANYQAAGRTAVSLLNLTLRDYGRNERLMDRTGYRKAIVTVRELTGEQRLEMDLTHLVLPEHSPGEVHGRPLRVTHWRRASPELVDLYATAKRVPFVKTGAERFHERRAAAKAGEWRIDRDKLDLT